MTDIEGVHDEVVKDLVETVEGAVVEEKKGFKDGKACDVEGVVAEKGFNLWDEVVKDLAKTVEGAVVE